MMVSWGDHPCYNVLGETEDKNQGRKWQVDIDRVTVSEQVLGVLNGAVQKARPSTQELWAGS